MKLCVITCYKQPDYVRALTLRAAGQAIDGVDVITVKNTRTGALRYLEVLARLIVVRIRLRPDAYLLTFRGYEMLLPVRLLSIGKPLLYDEFIHPIEWAVYEHKKLNPENLLVKLFTVLYRLLLSTVQAIITDTDSHAELSAKLSGINKQKIHTIPVGTDNTVFKVQPNSQNKGDFSVLYYGNMLPLHGLSYVIETAVKLKDEPVTFVLVGGDETTVNDVQAARARGANIDYKKWVNFAELPGLMNAANVCLAGPFGGTYQSNFVITGKAYQYLAMGRPTVVGKNKESHVFTNKVNALVVEQKNSQELAEIIQWSMDHGSELQSIGKAGYELYESEYSTKQLASRLEPLLANFTKL